MKPVRRTLELIDRSAIIGINALTAAGDVVAMAAEKQAVNYGVAHLDFLETIGEEKLIKVAALRERFGKELS